MLRPRVIANFALTADGKVSTRNGTPTGFTSTEDKRRLLEIRSRGDALLVGASTVKADHMAMRLSVPELQRQRLARGQTAEPRPVIASNSGRIDPEGKPFFNPPAVPLIFTTERMPASIRSKLSRRADLWIFEAETVPLQSLLAILRKDYDFRTVVCEGGPTLFRALLEIDAIDELHLTWAPCIFGGSKAPTLTGRPGAFLPETRQARLLKMESIGQECFLHYQLIRRRLEGTEGSPLRSRRV